MKFLLFNIETKTASKKSWKTYRGAVKNQGRFDIITTIDGVDWCIRHPEWGDERMELISKMGKMRSANGKIY